MNYGAIIKQITKFANPGPGGLDCNEKAVLCAIADHCHGEAKTAYPGIETIAHFAGCGRRTAIRTVQKLIDRNFLKAKKKHGKRTNYSFNVKLLTALVTVPKYRDRLRKYLKKTNSALEPQFTHPPSTTSEPVEKQCQADTVNSRTECQADTITSANESLYQCQRVTITSANESPEDLKKEKKKRTEGKSAASGSDAKKVQTPAGFENSHSKGSPPLSLLIEDDPPKPKSVAERIEELAPLASSESRRTLRELWPAKRTVIVEIFREYGIQNPTSDLLVTELREVMKAHPFNDKLSLGALLGPRWEEFQTGIHNWLGHADTRILPILPVLAGMVQDFDNDDDVRNSWVCCTGGAACPPVELIRRTIRSHS